MVKTKQEFLERLKDITPQEINEIIQERGKKPKLYQPFVIIHDENKKLNTI